MTTNTKPEKSMAELVRADNRIYSKIVHRAQLLNFLKQQVQAVLPSQLRAHCDVANWDNGRLIFRVDSGAWATRLRYEQIELIKQLRAAIPELVNLRTISYYVAEK